VQDKQTPEKTTSPSNNSSIFTDGKILNFSVKVFLNRWVYY